MNHKGELTLELMFQLSEQATTVASNKGGTAGENLSSLFKTARLRKEREVFYL